MNIFYKLLLTLTFQQICVSGNACNSICYNDQQPKCRINLEKSNVRNATGVYQIFDGIVHFSCTFESLPTPVEVSWKYRSRSENKIHTVPCAKISNTQNCSINDENRVHEECTLRLNNLDLSGSYKCEGSQANGMLISSHHADIEVVGIELAEVSLTKLHLDSNGFIEIRVCAHPEPEIFWILPDSTFLKPKQSRSKFSASELSPIVHKKLLLNEDFPSHYQPYCYSNRLLIGNVDEKDRLIDVIVQNSGESRRLHLNIQTKEAINLSISNFKVGVFGLITNLAFIYFWNIK